MTEAEARAVKPTLGVVLPVSPARYVTMTSAWPLTEVEWSNMLEILETMRPGLTERAQVEEAKHD